MLRAGNSLSRAARGPGHLPVRCAALFQYHLAEPLPTEVAKPQDIPPAQRSLVQFDNGVFLGATTSTSPLTTINMVVRAGSRYELPGEAGISHYLRRLAYKSTEKHTAVYMTCLPQWFGMRLSCTGTRDSIVYSGTCMKDDVDHLLDVMCQTVTAPKIFNWEVRYTPTDTAGMAPQLLDAQYRVNCDVSGVSQNRTAVLLEQMQSKAFRGGLSGTVYCPSHQIGAITEDAIRAYHARRYAGSNIGIFGAGIHYEDLQNGVTRHGLYNIAKGNETALQAEGVSIYSPSGVEVRIESNDSNVLGFLLAPGAGLCDDTHIHALLLQRVLGAGSLLESGVDVSRLQTAVSKTGPGYAEAQAVNISHSDMGLFGVQVVAAPNNIRQVLKAAMGEVARAGATLTDKELNIAKAQLSADLLATQETHEGVLEDMAYQCLYRGGKYLLPEKAIERVNNVTAKEVKAFAQSVSKAKPILGLHGQLHDAPHLDELGL